MVGDTDLNSVSDSAGSLSGSKQAQNVVKVQQNEKMIMWQIKGSTILLLANGHIK